MGVSFNPQGDYHNMLSFSYSGVWQFRILLANLLGFTSISDFLKHKVYEAEKTKEMQKPLKNKFERIIFHFVWQSDCEGSYSPKLCSKLIEALKMIDLDKIEDEHDKYDIEQLIEILEICVKTKTVLTWS